MSHRKVFTNMILPRLTSRRTKTALQLGLPTILIPMVPILYWKNTAQNERRQRQHDVDTKLRIPNVQSIDELIIEQCQPGDVLLFDRRCDCCADGFWAALSCFLGKRILCCEEDGTRSVENGTYEHCGIIVPGKIEKPSDEYDPTNLCLLEATSGSGITCRPLLTRLEMSRSRTIILLPLSCPNERRDATTIDRGAVDIDDDFDQLLSNNPRHPPENDHATTSQTRGNKRPQQQQPRKKQAPQHENTNKHVEQIRNYTNHELTQFREEWLAESTTREYASQHSFLSIIGALLYKLNLHPTFPIPVSPSAWLVVSALHKCGAAQILDERVGLLETKVEDFTRDGRFFERECVRLRPGYKFLAPVVIRETSTH